MEAVHVVLEMHAGPPARHFAATTWLEMPREQGEGAPGTALVIISRLELCARHDKKSMLQSIATQPALMTEIRRAPRS